MVYSKTGEVDVQTSEYIDFDSLFSPLSILIRTKILVTPLCQRVSSLYYLS